MSIHPHPHEPHPHQHSFNPDSLMPPSNLHRIRHPEARTAPGMRRLGLDVHEWGSPTIGGGVLPFRGPLPADMVNTQATGLALAGGDELGVDLIAVEAGSGFAPHTHPGDHLLIVVSGRGTVTWDGRIWPTRPGMVYFVPGLAPHAVGAIDDHLILAVGSPHRPVDSEDRQALVEYLAVASPLGELHCLICDRAGSPAYLRGQGCTHAPIDLLADAAR